MWRKPHTRLIGALAGAALLVGLTACSSSTSAGESPSSASAATEYQLTKPGTLTVATNNTSDPFLRSVKDGTVIGFEPDLIRELANRIGIKKVEFVASGFDTLIAGVGAGKFDVAAAGITGWVPEGGAAASTVAERSKIVIFTAPHLISPQMLISNEEINPGLMSIDDLKPGMKVGAMKASTGYLWALDNLAPKGIDVVATTDGSDVQLQSGQLDAFIASMTGAASAKKLYDNIQAGESIDELQVGFCFAISPKNEALRDDLDEALRAAVDDGTYKKLFEEYFPGWDVPELPTEPYKVPAK